MWHQYRYRQKNQPTPAPTPVETQPDPQPDRRDLQWRGEKIQHAHNHDPTGKPPEVVVFLLLFNKVYCVHAINFSRH